MKKQKKQRKIVKQHSEVIEDTGKPRLNLKLPKFPKVKKFYSPQKVTKVLWIIVSILVVLSVVVFPLFSAFVY